MQRRQLIQALSALTTLAAAATLSRTLMAQGKPRIEVWKDPHCGCCQDWVKHMQANGFQVEVHDSGNSAARAKMGVPQKLGSCHTAQLIVKGRAYALEGHVPAGDVQRLIKERPAAIGLAVPGMPIGSPGMDGPEYGGRQDPYDVLLIHADGSTRVYQSHHRAKTV